MMSYDRVRIDEEVELGEEINSKWVLNVDINGIVIPANDVEYIEKCYCERIQSSFLPFLRPKTKSFLVVPSSIVGNDNKHLCMIFYNFLIKLLRCMHQFNLINIHGIKTQFWNDKNVHETSSHLDMLKFIHSLCMIMYAKYF
jgi:hypothetical protein